MEVDGRLSLEERPAGLLGLGADLHNWGAGGWMQNGAMDLLQYVPADTAD